MEPAGTPSLFDKLPQELKEQVFQHLSQDDLNNLGDAFPQLWTSIWAYMQPELEALAASAAELYQRVQQIQTTLPTFAAHHPGGGQ